MSFDAGSAVGKYVLDIQDAEAKVKRLESLFSGLARQSSAVGGGGSASQARQAAQSNQAAERAILARAAAEARLAQVQNTGKNALAGLTQAEKIYSDALAKVNQNSVAAIRTQAQLAAVQNRIGGLNGGGLAVLPRTLESFGGQALDQIRNGLLGIVGPAALASAAFAGLSGAVQSFQRGFQLKAQLDQTTASIAIQLRGVRDSGQVFGEAAQFARQYGLTQQDTNAALSASVGILRNSTAGVQDLLGVLSRLQVVSPEQSLGDAALAVKELVNGDVQSLVERFEISRSAANAMKAEIQGGADAVQVLSRYLDGAGVSMDTLKTRTEGAQGALNNLKVAQEQLALAQGADAQGIGLAILQTRTAATIGLTRILGGAGGLTEAVRALTIEWQASVAADNAYIAAIQRNATDTEAAAARTAAYNAEVAALTSGWSAGGGVGLQYADVMDEIDRAARRGASGISAQTAAVNALAAAQGGAGGLQPKNINDRNPLATGLGGGAGSDTAAAARADAVRRSQLALAYAQAKTDAQRIAILNQELATTTDIVERNRILGQIAGLQNTTQGSTNRGLRTQLDTQKSIQASMEDQYRAALDLEELWVRDSQADLEDAQKRRTAERILNSPNASADAKARAANALALISVQDRKRQAEIDSRSGAVFQSVGGGAAPGAAPTGAAGASPAPAQAGAAGGGNVVTLRLVDSAGRVLADSVGPIIMDQLLAAAGAVALQRGL